MKDYTIKCLIRGQEYNFVRYGDTLYHIEKSIRTFIKNTFNACNTDFQIISID